MYDGTINAMNHADEKRHPALLFCGREEILIATAAEYCMEFSHSKPLWHESDKFIPSNGPQLFCSRTEQASSHPSPVGGNDIMLTLVTKSTPPFNTRPSEYDFVVATIDDGEANGLTTILRVPPPNRPNLP